MLQFKQQKSVKLCQKLGTSASKMVQVMKRVYGEESFKWHNRFAQRRDSLKDDEHIGRQERSELNLRSEKLHR
jgi:hypothetical protein